jgi:DNA-binding ferritin-like protein
MRFTSLKEYPGTYASSIESIKELLVDHEVIIVELRQGIGEFAGKSKDAGTIDFLTGGAA